MTAPLKFFRKRTAKLWRPGNEEAFYLMKNLFPGRTLLSPENIIFLESQGYKIEKTILKPLPKDGRVAIKTDAMEVIYNPSAKVWEGQWTDKSGNKSHKYYGRSKNMVMEKLLMAIKDINNNNLQES